MKFIATPLLILSSVILLLASGSEARSLRGSGGMLEKHVERSISNKSVVAEDDAVADADTAPRGDVAEASEGDDYFEELDAKADADDNFYKSGAEDSEDSEEEYVDDSKENLEEDEGEDFGEDEDDTEGADEDEDEVEEEEKRRKLQAQKWNVFKSYANSPRKPPQYAKKSVKHDIREYLTQNQLYMLKIRNGPETGPDMFGADWSGFNKNN